MTDGVKHILSYLMAFKTLTIKESTYKRVARHKEPGESFSDLLDREFDKKIATAEDLLAVAKSRLGRGLGLRQRKTKRKAA